MLGHLGARLTVIKLPEITVCKKIPRCLKVKLRRNGFSNYVGTLWSTRPYCGHFGTIWRIQKNHKGGHRGNLVHLTPYLHHPTRRGVPTAKLLKDMMAIGQGEKNEGHLLPGPIFKSLVWFNFHVFVYIIPIREVTITLKTLSNLLSNVFLWMNLLWLLLCPVR